MQSIKLMLIGAITVMFCSIVGITNATVDSFDPGTGTGTIGPGGSVK